MADNQDIGPGGKSGRFGPGHWAVAASALDAPKELELVQYDRLLALVPLLYVAIAINTLSSAIASRGDYPGIYQLLFPGILFGASLVRFFIWLGRRSQRVSLAVARRNLQRAVWIAILIGSFSGIWSVLAFYETHESRRVLAAIFVAFGAFAAANCLASLPRAAVAALFCSLAPISLALLVSADPGERAMGVSLILVAALQLRLVFSQYRAMVDAQTLHKAMRELADTDPLTGLKNRRALDRALHDAISAQADFSLVLLDLNGFKQVNDAYGHAFGDLLLVQVAERLVASSAPRAMIARLGGVEFAVLVPDGRSPHALEADTARMTALLGLPYVCDDEWLTISASAGVARFGRDGRTSAELLRVADHAVYHAKQARARGERQPQSKAARRKAA